MNNVQVYYYTNDRNTAEIDFIIDYTDNDLTESIIPIEVKAETNLKAKSLKAYNEKFNPTKAIRISMADYKDEGWILNLPLYAINILKSLKIQ